jgi:hypothetical protein
MWSFMNHPGIPTTTLDFTQGLSPLLAGLVVLVALSAAVLVWEASRYYRSQRHQDLEKTALTSADRREAA